MVHEVILASHCLISVVKHVQYQINASMDLRIPGTHEIGNKIHGPRYNVKGVGFQDVRACKNTLETDSRRTAEVFE